VYYQTIEIMTVDDPMHVEASEERILPQPTNPEAKSYRYLKFEQIEDEFFGDQENIQKPSTLLPDTLCWVYLSKGKGKRPQIHKRARVESSCEDDEERVLVKYPNGSTYRVRRTNLVPVLEHQSHLILVCSETKDYHRTSIVHTRQEDNFLEIGCDFGILVDKVDAKTRLGVDKSEESIKGARERYPNRAFLLGDVFEDDLNITLESPAVVAIDINGNRMLPAVLDCIQLALEKWSPRLIVVKSRELYAKLR
jgi:hypothetical protein